MSLAHQIIPKDAEVPATLDRRENLPGLLARAGQRLLDARTSAEVLEAKKLAEAALHYAKVTKAANETHADCIRIITRAEMRMADEIDRGQASGDVSVAGGDRQTIVRSPDNAPATFDDLGIDRRRVAEWREVRDAGEAVVENAITKALDEGRTPTKADIYAAAKELRAVDAAVSRTARVEKIAEISRGNIELSTGIRYPIVYADPPWRYENPPIGSTSRAIENHYPTMTLEEICALPVGDLATDDALLYLWATAPKLAECLKVIEAWGFTYRTNMIWDKEKIGMGYHARNQHEILLIAKRGEIPPPPPGTQPSSVHRESRGEHSAKPIFYYEMIEAAYPQLPKIELFSRSPREGWKAWGNQAEAA